MSNNECNRTAITSHVHHRAMKKVVTKDDWVPTAYCI